MGMDAKDKAVVEMWNRRMEFEVLWNTASAFRNTSDFFKGRIPQVKEYGEICRSAARQTPGMARHGARRSRIHRGTALHDCGYHGDDRNRFRPDDWNQDPGESEEPRPMASGGIEPSQRQGIAAIHLIEA